MESYEEILEEFKRRIKESQLTPKEIEDLMNDRVLVVMKRILDNNNYSDSECFTKIANIIRLFE